MSVFFPLELTLVNCKTPTITLSPFPSDRWLFPNTNKQFCFQPHPDLVLFVFFFSGYFLSMWGCFRVVCLRSSPLPSSLFIRLSVSVIFIRIKFVCFFSQVCSCFFPLRSPFFVRLSVFVISVRIQRFFFHFWKIGGFCFGTKKIWIK